MTPYQLLYLTCATREEALAICQSLLTEKRIACANILPSVTSLYHWEGTLQEQEEVAVLMKAPPQAFDGIAAQIKALHSYDCPCLIALPIVQGYAPFLEWIEHSCSVSGVLKQSSDAQ